MAKNTKTRTAKDATVETAATPAPETVTSTAAPVEASAAPAPDKKAKKEKPVKMIGPFTALEIDKLVLKGDKKNPVSFKTWAKKNVPTLGAETPEIAREAYDNEMAEHKAAHPFSKKDLREIMDASEVIAQPRKHTFKKIERSLVVLRKHKIINEAPKTAWVGGHNVHFQLTYTPLGRLTLGEQMGKKKLRKHMARTSVSATFSTSAATH